MIATITAGCFFSGHGQGTIEFIGFEEYPLGATPPFVAKNYSAEPFPTVENNPGYTPFEGSKYLHATGAIGLESPTHGLIQHATLHMYLGVDINSTARIIAGIGNVDIQPSQYNSWQSYDFTFDPPVTSIGVSAFYDIGERFPLSYALDAVEFTTIPEPQTYVLLLGAACALFATRRKRNPV